MSNKGYPGGGAVAFATNPGARGFAGMIIIFVYNEMGRQTGRSGVPDVKRRLPIPKLPVWEAFKLGWWFGEKLHDWIHGENPWGKGTWNFPDAVCHCGPFGENWIEECTVYSEWWTGCAGCGSVLPSSFCNSGVPFNHHNIRSVTRFGHNSWLNFGRVQEQWDLPANGIIHPPEWFYPLPETDIRPVPKTGELPQVEPVADPPWLDPEDMPLPHEGAWDFPAPPYGVIPALGRMGNPNRQVGPQPAGRPNPWNFDLPRPRGQARELPRQNLRPSERPGEQTQIQPDAPPGRRWEETKLRDRKPGRNQKEVKLRTNNRGLRIIRGILNAVTEGKDVIDALEKSLPKDCRPKPKKGKGGGVTPQQKIAALYKCADRIDFCKAVRELVENQVEDFIYGSASSKLGAPTGKRMGRPVGPQAGMVDRPERGKAKVDKELRELLKDLEPGEVAGDVVEAVMNEIGACN